MHDTTPPSLWKESSPEAHPLRFACLVKTETRFNSGFSMPKTLSVPVCEVSSDSRAFVACDMGNCRIRVKLNNWVPSHSDDAPPLHLPNEIKFHTQGAQINSGIKALHQYPIGPHGLAFVTDLQCSQ